LGDEFIQEELRDDDLNGGQHKNEENIYLSSQVRKRKFKKVVSGESTSREDKKNDMRNVKCFACHMFGNYARHFLHNKKGWNETQPEVALSTY
jgi:hypothetical protein